jgi:hypothetical protein
MFKSVGKAVAFLVEFQNTEELLGTLFTLALFFNYR